MKKIFLTTVIMIIALSAYAQRSACAYICDNSGTPTNIRNAPNGKVVEKLPITFIHIFSHHFHVI